MKPGQSTYPVFVFDAQTGVLYFNSFGRRPKMRARREITEIIAHLTAEAEAGRIPLDGVVVGWPGDGRTPLIAADTSDAEIMRPWLERAYVVDVKLDRSDEAAIVATVDEDVERA